MRTVQIGGRTIGEGEPCWVIAEIGINANGDVGTAIKMIEAAKASGADAIKFQKRTVDLCVPEAMKAVVKETPWGLLTYLEYKRKIEFDQDGYDRIDKECRRLGIPWFASAWDAPSVEFLMRYALPCLKAASASATDLGLFKTMRDTGLPVIASTGMCEWEDVDNIATLFSRENLILLHCVSTYPADVSELNLNCIPEMIRRFNLPIGYSGHEIGISTTVCAVVLGASVVERHFTLDRSAWGTDQAASLEPEGLRRMVRDVRKFERARGDGVKRILESERPVMARLRRQS